MLAIRMQRTGRKGHAQFRVIVQDARLTPTSGKVVAQLGHYNPHSKQAVLDKDKAQTFLNNGAQPSERVVKLLQSEGVKLPNWVKVASGKKQRSIKNVEKLRRNRPAEAETPTPAEEAGEPVAADDAATTADGNPTADVADQEQPTSEVADVEPVIEAVAEPVAEAQEAEAAPAEAPQAVEKPEEPQSETQTKEVK